jgi:hypothetical protein
MGMVAIRAHFDGTVIVPDEPVPVLHQTDMVVLINSPDSAAVNLLEQATRQYYQASGDDTDDDEWGRGLAPDSQNAWE